MWPQAVQEPSSAVRSPLGLLPPGQSALACRKGQRSEVKAGGEDSTGGKLLRMSSSIGQAPRRRPQLGWTADVTACPQSGHQRPDFLH